MNHKLGRPAALVRSVVLPRCHHPVFRHGSRIDGDPPEQQRLEPPVLLLAASQPRARVRRGRRQRRLGDQSGPATRAHNGGGRFAGNDGPLLPAMTNASPGEVYVLKEAMDASEAQSGRHG